MDLKHQPIGFLDSGVGGLSVLKEAMNLLPNENYIYIGDSKNAPYGTKEVEEVKILTFNVVEELMNKNIKALVVACNTATSAAIKSLRQKYPSTPIIGIEPALKPAVELKKEGKIIIMATPMTLKENKFNQLLKKYEKEAEIIPLPCAGLVEYIENGIIEGKEINNYLTNKIYNCTNGKIGAIVLGCTHYPFIKKELQSVVPNTIIIDGSVGTSKELKRKLINLNLLNNSKEKGKVEIYNTLMNDSIIKLSYKLLENYI